MRDDVTFQIINDELYLDGNARQNLATFDLGTTRNVHKLMIQSGSIKRIDKEEYSQSAAIDLRCVNMVAEPGMRLHRNGQLAQHHYSSEVCMPWRIVR